MTSAPITLKCIFLFQQEHFVLCMSRIMLGIQVEDTITVFLFRWYVCCR